MTTSTKPSPKESIKISLHLTKTPIIWWHLSTTSIPCLRADKIWKGLLSWLNSIDCLLSFPFGMSIKESIYLTKINRNPSSRLPKKLLLMLGPSSSKPKSKHLMKSVLSSNMEEVRKGINFKSLPLKFSLRSLSMNWANKRKVFFQK